MNVSVVAVLVVHESPDYFSETLRALQSQTRRVDKIVVIDTSNSEICTGIAQQAGITEIHKLPENSTLGNSLAFAAKQIESAEWLWVLHDDSAPLPDALSNLISAVEQSPSVAIAGPKLLDWNNPKVIDQMGLTLSPMGNLFSIISGEIDQSQHDDLDDVMAVSTAAALIRFDVYKTLSGIDTDAPPLAADFDFSIRARLAGHRVIVVPRAKVRHASLSLKGERPHSWLGGSPKSALRRASIHLRLAYSPLVLAALFWLALPIIGLGRAIFRIASKRPDRIWSEISAATWGFFTIGARLRSRSRISKSSVGPIKFANLSPLRASWQQVRNAKLAAIEKEQSTAITEAFDRGEFQNEGVESPSGSRSPGFIASGAHWVALALTLLSFTFWPTNIAAVGGGLLPLSDSWLSLFSRAGASFQPIGLGYFAPSDPFAWVLTAFGGLTFWAPSLSLAILLLVAKALAFAGAWHVATLFAKSSSIRIASGLVFALWPVLTLTQQEARIPAVIAQVLLPWFVFSVARAAGLGRTNFTTQTWSWVAASGLLLFAISASAPSVTLFLFASLVLFILVILANGRLRKSSLIRAGYLIWVFVPTVLLFTPTVFYYLVETKLPSALLADPGLPQQSLIEPIWQQALGGSTFGLSLPLLGQISGWVTIPAILIAVAALLTSRWKQALVLWLSALLTLLAAWFLTGIKFPAVGVGSTEIDNSGSNEYVSGSPAALLAIFGLLISALLAIGLSALKSKVSSRLVGASLTIFFVAPSLYLLATLEPRLNYTDARVIPSIVAAESRQGSELKTLVIEPKLTSNGAIEFEAALISGDGTQLEDVSLSYRFVLKSLQESRVEEYESLSQLVANLSASNGTDLGEALESTGIGYLLVPNQKSQVSSQLAIALDSVKELESVGLTDFGRLWRVREPNQDLLNATQAQSNLWSITKGIQVAVLVGFALLAIPSFNQRKRNSKDSSIFVEAGEES